MENEMNQRPKPLSIIVWTVATLCLLIGIAAVVYEEHDTIENYLHGENQEVVQDTLHDMEEPVYTIQDYVEIRNQMKEERRIDSVFLAIPDVVLIDILSQHGTDLSITDIVYIYESNSTTYNSVLSGARAQKYLEDSIQKIPKDTAKTDIIPK